jgi:hypothetical protein
MGHIAALRSQVCTPRRSIVVCCFGDCVYRAVPWTQFRAAHASTSAGSTEPASSAAAARRGSSVSSAASEASVHAYPHPTPSDLGQYPCHSSSHRALPPPLDNEKRWRCLCRC